ncbi:MAG TPA: hypothetical protein VGG53_08420 [Mycobacterium sp.]|uniref:hypothetical protein n=1 Tax=Mycobacterium sp. TaxID=1785 RepID=UPI002F3F7C5C
MAAAAGGLVGAAFLATATTATAFADSYQISPDPSSSEVVTGFFGEPATPPAVAGSVQGGQVFDVFDKTTGQTVGTFDADESTQPSLYGAAHELLLVTSDLSGTGGTATGDTPPVGSVIDIADYGHGYQTIFSALAGSDGDVLTKTLTTPFGTVSMPAYYDVAAGLGSHTLDDTPLQLTDGYYLAPATEATENISAVTGVPPADIAVEGNDVFEVYNASDQAMGAFEADVTNTSDVLFNYTEEIFVTQDVSGTVGTAAGDTPAVGTLYNVFYLFGSHSIYNLYSVTPSSSGNVVSDTLVSPYGEIKIPIPWDATTATAVNSFTIPTDGESIVPVGNEQIFGFNGVPPLDSSVQGFQMFEVDDASGNPIGTFDADITTATGLFGNSSEAVLVTADSGAAGLTAGDLPPVGSVFDVNDYGFGYETIYSDLVSTTGANVVTETFVTPMGDFALQPFIDLAANVPEGSFFIPTSLTDLVSSLF